MSEFTFISCKLPYIIFKLDQLGSTYTKYSPVFTFLGMKYRLKVDLIYNPATKETECVITFVRISTHTLSQFKFQMSTTATFSTFTPVTLHHAQPFNVLVTTPNLYDSRTNSVEVSLNDEKLCIFNEKLAVMLQQTGNNSSVHVSSVMFCITTSISRNNITMIPNTTVDDDYDWAVNLSNDFRKLFNSEEHSDFVLKCGDKCFPAHRAVLAVRSPVFAAMFRSDMKESREGSVDIQNVESDILEKFLHYLYTGKTPDLSIDSARKLHSIADMYQVEALKLECSFFAMEQVKKLGGKFDVPEICCPTENEKSEIVKEFEKADDEPKVKRVKGDKKAGDEVEGEILKELFHTNEWNKLLEQSPKLAHAMINLVLFRNQT